MARPRATLVLALGLFLFYLFLAALVCLHAPAAHALPSLSPTPLPEPTATATPAPDHSWALHWRRQAAKNRVGAARLASTLGQAAPAVLPAVPKRSGSPRWEGLGAKWKRLAHDYVKLSKRYRAVLREPVALGKMLAAARGWTGAEWLALYALWNRESGWVVHKWNYAGSGAYGIPQALPGSKMGAGWRDSALVQIKWGLGYIGGKYGCPCRANAYQLANGSY